MMDPVSVITSVNTSCSTVGQLLSTLKKYISNARAYPATIDTITGHLAVCQPQLACLLHVIQHDSDAADLQQRLNTTGVIAELKACLEEMQEFVAMLPTRPGLGQTYNKAMWELSSQRKADKLVERLEKCKGEIRTILLLSQSISIPIIKAGTEGIKDHLSEDKRRRVLHWLKPPDTGSMHETHAEKRDLQEDETCDWITGSTIWRQLLQGGSAEEEGWRRFLWIWGIPGAGKTILASFLIEQLRRHCKDNGVSYYYCSFLHRRDETRYFLRWIITDLCRQSSYYVPPALEELHRSRDITAEALQSCLEAVCQNAKSRVYIVIDGVDESQNPRKDLLKVLTTIGTSGRFGNASLVMISRKEADIEEAITGINTRQGAGNLDYSTSSFQHKAASFTPRDENQQTGGGLLNRTPKRTASYENDDRHVKRNSPGGSAKRTNQPYSPDSSRFPMTSSGLAYSDFGDPSPSHAHMELHSTHQAPQIIPSLIRPLPSAIDRNSETNGDHGDGMDWTADPYLHGWSNKPPQKPGHKEVEVDIPIINGPCCTILSMSNPLVEKAIRVYIHNQLRRIDELGESLSPKQIEEVETRLARGAKGMFRWAACQVELIKSGQIFDFKSIERLLNDLPGSVFATYQRMISHSPPDTDFSSDKTFARTALALICSDSARIPDAGVLTMAARFAVKYGTHHNFTLQRLKKVLGCLVKVTSSRRPFSFWDRPEDPPGTFQRITPAHYTVKEFLFNESSGDCNVTGDFALTRENCQLLELEVAFNELLQARKPREGARPDPPTRYEEYCLKMTDKALYKHRSLIMREEKIWEHAVLPCLERDSLPCRVLTNGALRKAFPRWARLATYDLAPANFRTGILVNLIILKCRDLIKMFLETVPAGERDEIWSDRFRLRQPRTGPVKMPESVIQLCVMGRHTDFLEMLIDAGASLTHEQDVVLLALKDPYEDGDGSTTGELLTILPERGGNPHPDGFKFTPLQFAVQHLEERWVYSILAESPDPNAVGDPNGEHPWELDGVRQDWHTHHPLQICRLIRPDWAEDEDDPEVLAEQIRKSRTQIRSLLELHGATERHVIEIP
ncbi:ankyrin repeat protein [Seiridium cupressi]